MAENIDNASASTEESSETDLQARSNMDAVTKQLEALNQQFAKQQEFNQVMVEQINRKQEEALKASTPAPESFYDLTPEEYEKQLERKMEARIKASQEEALKRQSKLAEIVQDYPEANQAGSEMYNKMIEFNSQLPQGLRDTPEGYEVAATRAAKALGVVPASLRKGTNPDDFSISSNSSSGGTRSKKQSAAVTQKTKAFAQLLGLDIDNKDQIKRLEERAKRDTWGRYR